ncbi:MAG: hypothetical protein OKBPIBMD_00249 [Chlorobi bacterium]|nr:hypothetical protein [Chlorobiota bacterium]
MCLMFVMYPCGLTCRAAIWFHIENHDVSCRWMLTAPYNGLSIDMRIRTGRPRGVAPTELSFTLLFREGGC